MPRGSLYILVFFFFLLFKFVAHKFCFSFSAQKRFCLSVAAARRNRPCKSVFVRPPSRQRLRGTRPFAGLAPFLGGRSLVRVSSVLLTTCSFGYAVTRRRIASCRCRRRVASLQRSSLYVRRFFTFFTSDARLHIVGNGR